MGSTRPSKKAIEVDFTFTKPESDDEVQAVAEVLFEDEGIGGYEFWGARGNDVNWCPHIDRAYYVSEGVEVEIDPDTIPESLQEAIFSSAEDEAYDGGSEDEYDADLDDARRGSGDA